jgi:AraC-like DNA-binding protein
LIGGNRVTVDARTLTLFWAAVPHQVVEFRDVTHYYVITIPFGWFLQWGLPETLQTQLIVGSILSGKSDQRTAIRDSSQFEQWNEDLSNAPDDSRDIVLLELKARLLRLARDHYANPVHSADDRNASQNNLSPNLAKAEKMACYIARNFKSRLQIKEIADCVDLHPDYASTLFRKTFGATLNGLITRHRVAEAQRLLISSDDQIIDIAFAAGFDSLSRFNRAFKQTTGMTPRGFRKDCRIRHR